MEQQGAGEGEMKRTLANVYIGAAFLAGATSLAVSTIGVRASSIDPLMFVLLLGLGAIAQRNLIMLFRSSAISMSFAVVTSSFVLFGPAVALWVVLVVAATNTLTATKNPVRKAMFNFGQLAVSTTAAAGTYQLVGGSVPPGTITSTVIAVAIASAVGFLLNSTLTAGIIALTSDARFPSVWIQNFSWMPLNYVATAVNGAALALAYQSLGVFGAAIFVLPLGVAWYSFRLYVTRSREVRAENEKLSQLNRLFNSSKMDLADVHVSMVGALLGSLEAKNAAGAGQLAATVYRSVRVARRLELDEAAVKAVQLGALFHDLGNIGIPDAILEKGEQLTDQERAEIRSHPIIGASLLAHVPDLDHIRPIILAHHERFDGTGYPNGLRGALIPRAAQIVAVADAYGSMTAAHPYRRALTQDAAIAALRSAAGTQFDPAVVEAFVEELHVAAGEGELAQLQVYRQTVETVRAGR
jgi:hypothetical protein